MKSKLAQRIALGYYKTKFKTMALLSPRKAAESAFKLFCTPYSGKPKRKEPPMFHKAEKLQFDLNGLTVRGWRWKATEPNAKKVLIVHGFDSCSYKFDKYVPLLHAAGFEVLAFDAPGHGISDGTTINALVYKGMMQKADELYGKFYGIMAHSLGGLAASLAAEEMLNLKKLVLIAPAVETDRAVNYFFKLIPLGDTVKTAFENLMMEIAQRPVSYFSVSRAIKNIHIPVLWLHDEEDRICPYEDVLPVIKLNINTIEFYTTKGLGHSVYRDDKAAKKIVDFLVG